VSLFQNSVSFGKGSIILTNSLCLFKAALPMFYIVIYYYIHNIYVVLKQEEFNENERKISIKCRYCGGNRTQRISAADKLRQRHNAGCNPPIIPPVIPQTATVIIAAIQGVTVPVTGGIPQ
jgi:hypothetical protein